VPGPEDDLDVSEFARAIAAAGHATGQPPALYLIPTFHNPTGRVISAARRQEILILAHEAGALVIEDQAYAGLGYEPVAPPPPLWHYAPDPDLVISLYSFAKTLAPGLRVGWLVSGERTVASLAADATRRSGGGPSHFAAMVIAGGCLTDELDRHIAAVREQLAARRDVLLAALTGRLPDGFSARRPAGGFFTWIDLPAAIDDEALLREAERAGVSFAAGRRFGASARGARLCFAACGPHRLEEGAARFLHACQLAASSD
jgi:DNA-binding transcriptional MocR family regulator